MTQGVRTYLLSVSAAAILLSLVQTVLPENAIRRVAAFAGGMLLILTVLSPVVQIQADELTAAIGRIRPDTEAVEEQAKRTVRESMGLLIKQKSETYILDKARQSGIQIEAEVIVSDDGEYPIPEKVILTGSVSPAQMQALSNIISNDLGIPPRRQEWRIS